MQKYFSCFIFLKKIIINLIKCQILDQNLEEDHLHVQNEDQNHIVDQDQKKDLIRYLWPDFIHELVPVILKILSVIMVESVI